MQRCLAACAAFMFLAFGLCACGAQEKDVQWVDGTYTAEFKEYDSYGYKDYLVLTVQDGGITAVEYDGKNAEGTLKTAEEKYGADMEKTQGTSPVRYTADLGNQLVEKGLIDQVDDIAGATWSSECFKALFNALAENSLPSGDTSLLLVDNVPEK